MINKTVIILAGGEGSRVKRYFPNTIKPLLLINGIPIIERIISLFKDFTIFINCNEEDKSQLEYLHLPLLIEKLRVGNAGALYFFRKNLGKKFIVIHVDEFCSLNPDDLWLAHKPEAAMTMMIKNVARKKEFGLVIATGDNLITSCDKARWVNTGIYCCTDKIFDYINPLKFQDLDNDLFPQLIKNNLLYAFKFYGYWQDVGTRGFLKRMYEEEKTN